MTTAADEAIAGMEPITSELGFLSTMGEAATVSIAISLKRIADEICNQPDRPGLVCVLDYIQQRLGPQS